MQENYLATCRIYAYIGWAVTMALIVAAWVVMLFDPPQWRLAFLLGGTGCVCACVAGTLHVRSFAVRVCALIRAASYKPVDGEGLHAVR